MARSMPMRNEAGLSVDVGGPGVCCGGQPLGGADYREPAVVRLPAGADHAPREPFPGARLSPQAQRIARLRAEIDRIRRWPVGDWQAMVTMLEKEICWAQQRT